ncbi:SigE family RNA polymerase sigma factor [Nocardioides psychrotolerans]|uniref:SigE family RNA polymerase sigma factor n=1 Tax=Nocardioides psychrotolerans TaxID=1005945 RepID=UPI003137DC1C
MSTDLGTFDEQEFEEFALARTPQLYRSAWLLCGDRHQAEDLVQETLAKVYARWRRPFVSRIDNPAAYAQTTLTRTFLSARRRRSNHETPYAALPDAAAPDLAAASDLRLALCEALGRLTPVDRAVVVLRYLEDLSVDEVAARTGLSSGAVRNRSMRSLERLRPLVDVDIAAPQNPRGTP